MFFRREVNSTNEWAKELAEEGAEEGTITLAQTQKAGCGRLGREWISPKGGLWFSIILRPNQKASEAAKLVFVAGLAVAEVLQEKYGFEIETKWPNDVLVKGRKICGILCEMNTKGENVSYLIVGVGLNVNFSVHNVLPESIRSEATSIEDEQGGKVQLESLLGTLLQRMEECYRSFLETGFADTLRRWKNYAAFLGRTIIIIEPHRLKGLAMDVDNNGALIVKLDEGTIRKVVAGDIAYSQQAGM